MKKLLLVAAAAGAVGAALGFFAQGRPATPGGGTDVQATPRAAVPRTPWDGKPDLSGVWEGGGIGASSREFDRALEVLDALYQPLAKERMKDLSLEDDPSLRCIPQSYPRSITTPHPFQIVQAPGVVVILNSSFHQFRIIPTDGSPHAADVFPTYQGDSEGRWEGDTLVVDVAAFNGQTWLADGTDRPGAGVNVLDPKPGTGGWFTSDALHVVERWRRIDADTLEYQATVEDPQVLTGPWQTPAVTVKRAPLRKIPEGVCLDTTTYVLTDAAARQR